MNWRIFNTIRYLAIICLTFFISRIFGQVDLTKYFVHPELFNIPEPAAENVDYNIYILLDTLYTGYKGKSYVDTAIENGSVTGIRKYNSANICVDSQVYFKKKLYFRKRIYEYWDTAKFNADSAFAIANKLWSQSEELVLLNGDKSIKTVVKCGRWSYGGLEIHHYRYDRKSRLVSIEQHMGDDKIVHVKFYYNKAGRLHKMLTYSTGKYAYWDPSVALALADYRNNKLQNIVYYSGTEFQLWSDIYLYPSTLINKLSLSDTNTEVKNIDKILKRYNVKRKLPSPVNSKKGINIRQFDKIKSIGDIAYCFFIEGDSMRVLPHFEEDTGWKKTLFSSTLSDEEYDAKQYHLLNYYKINDSLSRLFSFEPYYRQHFEYKGDTVIETTVYPSVPEGKTEREITRTYFDLANKRISGETKIYKNFIDQPYTADHLIYSYHYNGMLHETKASYKITDTIAYGIRTKNYFDSLGRIIASYEAWGQFINWNTCNWLAKEYAGNTGKVSKELCYRIEVPSRYEIDSLDFYPKRLVGEVWYAYETDSSQVPSQIKLFSYDYKIKEMYLYEKITLMPNRYIRQYFKSDGVLEKEILHSISFID